MADIPVYIFENENGKKSPKFPDINVLVFDYKHFSLNVDPFLLNTSGSADEKDKSS